MKKNFIFLIAFISLLSIGVVVFAQIDLPNPLGTTDSFECLIKKIATYISGIIGVLAVLMFIISGIQFVTSAGNPGSIEKAKKTALYAAIGLAVALAGAGLIELVGTIIGVSVPGSSTYCPP